MRTSRTRSVMVGEKSSFLGSFICTVYLVEGRVRVGLGLVLGLG